MRAGAWPHADPQQERWSTAELEAARGLGQQVGATAILVVHRGRIVATWGDPTVKVNARSVRKSLLSALYGIGVGQGRIDLRLSLADLDIDEAAPGLSVAERRATIKDLLMARSGVYHPAAYESPEMKAARPPRGSHSPGAFWYYNNWDFNALGTIYERLMGESVFAGFEARVARPIGMDDFSAADGRFVHDPCSRHPAYPMALSARDLARFGLLFLGDGRWDGQEIVPAGWIGESTTPFSVAARGLDYGYMWWVIADRTPLARTIGPGSFAAFGHGGQAVFVSRERQLVVVQLVVTAPGPAQSTRDRFAGMLARIIAAMPGG